MFITKTYIRIFLASFLSLFL